MDEAADPNPYYRTGNSSASTGPELQNQRVPRKNAQWNARETAIFVAACESVIADGHRNGKCFTKHGWETLINLFNTTSGRNWNKQQLKNRWDALRIKHKRFEELLNCSGISYDPSTGKIGASEEWWNRKMKENKDYKDFKDKDCREVYRYKSLFGDVFDSDKYAVTPSKLCRTGFAMFEDSATEDHRDEIPVDVESSGSSDEAVDPKPTSATMDLSGPHSGEKRKSGGDRAKGKKKKFSSRDVSFSVDRATSASEKVAARIDQMIGPPVSDPKTCLHELLSTGQLQVGTELYFWTCSFLREKKNREILDMQPTADLKFAMVQWSWQDHTRGKPG